jgi:RNA polymerase sigma-70 factor, ECF subfamily
VIKRAKLGPVTPEDAAPDNSGNPATLRSLLVNRYGDLRKSLSRRLGSEDWADEALQDTFLKIDRVPQDHADHDGPIRNPMAYLMRTALNTALNQRRAEKRRLSDVEIDDILNVPDDTPDSFRIMESRADVARFKTILMGLSPRARQILIAARLDGMTRPEIAERLGVSLSLVEKELRSAHEYCVRRFRAGKIK